MHTLIDADGDGHAPAAGGCGDDCDDGDPRVQGGKVCYTDADNDGYGDATASIKACACPNGTTVRGDAFDCDDNNADVHPGDTLFWPVPYTTPSGAMSWDYNCDGKVSREHLKAKGACSDQAPCAGKYEWLRSTVPECGESAYLLTCKPCSGTDREQGCR